ncbi:uncharacterized protein METZ01_LOCUS307744, partial [marine metagenome]
MGQQNYAYIGAGLTCQTARRYQLQLTLALNRQVYLWKIRSKTAPFP